MTTAGKPTDWRDVPLKRLGRVRYGLGQPPPLAEAGIPIIRATNVSRGAILANNLIYTQLDDLPLDRAPLLEDGEILVVRSGACTGDSARITGRWVGSAPGYDLRITSSRADSRFLAYSFLGKMFSDQIELVKSRAAQPHLNAEELGSVVIRTPRLEDQWAIADFLDTETTRIDDLIAKKRRLVALSEERIDNLIQRRIADSKLVNDKSNGTITLIKKVLKKVKRPLMTESEMVTAFRDGQVTARSLRRVDGYTLSWTDNSQLQGVFKNDIVIHGLDGFSGAIGVSEIDGVCSPVYHVCAPRSVGDPVYLGRLLRLLAVSGYLRLFASSTRERAVDFRNWDLFGNIPIPDVDPSEQWEIGASIRKIVPLKLAVERSAELAREYRQALITAAVTGEMDLPGVPA